LTYRIEPKTCSPAAFHASRRAPRQQKHDLTAYIRRQDRVNLAAALQLGIFLEDDLPMPATPHVEKHFTATDTVRDVVIGMADGLTVPFALAAGLAAAVSTTKVIVTAGLAEIVAGAIAMGLGGYLAARKR
jgi:hypothetical protein